MSNLPPTEPMTPERQTLEKLKALKASFDSQPNVSMWDHEGWLRKKKAYESSLIHTADVLFTELERAWASEAALREEIESRKRDAEESYAIIRELRTINVEPGISLGKAREWKRDKERLDWLGYTGHGFVRGTDFSKWTIESPEEDIRTIRTAIDTVMADATRERG